jgi:SAM-dependent methyltransferase
MAQAYERWLVPAVFRPFAVDMAERVAGSNPQRVLEVAAGSGVLTRSLCAAMPTTEIVATDLNRAMVDVGATLAPAARWEQADAMSLPFEDGRFDVVACQFGVMFFPDRVAGLREMARVVAAHGTVLFSVWDAVARHDFASALQAGLEKAFPDDPPMFVVAVPHGYADVSAIERDVAIAGLLLVSCETLNLDGHATSAADLAAGFCLGTPLRAEIESRGDVSVTLEAVTSEMESRLGVGPVSGRMSAHIIHVGR